MKKLDITLEQFKDKINSLEDILSEKDTASMDLVDEHFGFDFWEQLIDVVNNEEILTFLVVQLKDGLYKVPVTLLDSEVADSKMQIFLDDITEVTTEDFQNLLDYQFDLVIELERTNRMANILEYLLDNQK